MGRAGSVAAACSVFGLALVCQTEARAQDDPAPDEDAVRIEYEAPEDCASASDFLHEVLSRTKHGRLASRQQLARVIRVSVAPRGEEMVGRLEFTDRDSQPVVREVSAASCAELLPGLTLVTALAIDAQATEQAEPLATAPTVPSEPSPPSPCPEPAPPAVSPQPLPPQQAPRAVEPQDSGAEPTATDQTGASPDRSRAEWMVGAQAVAASAVAPGTAFGGAAFVSFGPGPQDWSARVTIASASAVRSEDIASRARFDWLALRTDFCPLSVKLGPISGRPCALAEGGGLYAAGRTNGVILESNAEWTPWAAVGMLARLDVPVTSWMLAELEGGGVAPLVRRTYRYVQPADLVHEVPAVGWGAAAGLSLRIP